MSSGFTNGNLQLGGSAITYVAPTSFTPAISASVAGPDSITYTAQEGRYQRIGGIIYYSLYIQINAFTLGAGSGDILITGFPVTSANIPHPGGGTCSLGGVDVPGTTDDCILEVQQASTNGKIQVSVDNAPLGFVQLSGLAAGDIIEAVGLYFCE